MLTVAMQEEAMRAGPCYFGCHMVTEIKDRIRPSVKVDICKSHKYFNNDVEEVLQSSLQKFNI